MRTKFFIIILILTVFNSKAQVGIGTVLIDNSAALELLSTDKGFLIPRMTKAEMVAIVNPADGLFVFDNTGDRYWYYNGSSWVNISDNTGLKLVDQDNDTQVHVEKTPDEDIIRFEIAGTDRWAFEGKRLMPINSGSSIFIGEMTGENDDLTWKKNVYLGNNTGIANVIGEDNVGIGINVLTNNTKNSNIGIGNYALSLNVPGENNTAIGRYSLESNNNGGLNAAIGFFSNAGGNNGYKSTSVGYLSMVTTGEESTTIGFKSAGYGLQSILFQVTSLGSQSLYETSTGNFNTATGYLASYKNDIYNYTTSFGTEAAYEAQGDEFTAFGYQALYFNAGNSTAIGYMALRNSFGGSSTAIGFKASQINYGADQVAIGNNALQNNQGDYNVAVGVNSLLNNNNGYNNTAVGFQSLLLNADGFSNTAIGYQSLYNNLSNFNVAIGKNSMYDNTTGYTNVAIGEDALKSNINGIQNTAIGYLANSTATNINNSTGIGYNANPSASNTIVIGNASINSIKGQVSWTNLSDGRLKKNIKENVVGLDFIIKLRPITYKLDLNALANFNKTPDSLRLKESELLKQKEIYSGFIAQEVEKASLEVAYDFHGIDRPKNNQSHYGLRYAEFVVPLVKGMQEQQEELNAMDNQLSNLQKEIDEIKAMLKNK
jgi:hypothetical protein